MQFSVEKKKHLNNEVFEKRERKFGFIKGYCIITKGKIRDLRMAVKNDATESFSRNAREDARVDMKDICSSSFNFDAAPSASDDF